MARSLSIAAYLTQLGAVDAQDDFAPQPPRPEGAIIWARCSNPDQLAAMDNLARRLTADGDLVHIVATLSHWEPEYADRALPEPRGRLAFRAFLEHWRPAMCVWLKGGLDALLLDEMRRVNLQSILVDANGEGLRAVTGHWVPGALRSVLTQFEAVFALDAHAAEKLARAGTPPELIVIAGAMEDNAPPLPYNDDERRELSQAIGTRPVWLAAAAHPHEWLDLCRAHDLASRKTHRLLLIVVPSEPKTAFEMAENMRQAGFLVALRSQQPDPADVTQIYIVDTDEELGLWYRIAPITYLGGTLHGGKCRDPFEATALGSAVVYGPHVAPFQRHAARLNANDASRLIRANTDLGPAIEGLLAADKTAELAHRAWDVTSRGANVTNRIATYIELRLEELVI
ncbi:3-deoxy-D-manno-octulosonic acid transferase [Yoonia sp.]|uniref:3-deoxy-D-manno-octulosonic acid transferase n=1 Tax=Yoonia sp. TaxID=2212373 RepID=UPI0035C7FEEE